MKNDGSKISVPVLLLGAGMLLLLLLLISQNLLLSGTPGYITHLLFRVAFWVTLPFRLLILPIFPARDHHYPLAHWVVLSLGAPFFYYWVIVFVKVIMRGKRKGVPESREPAPVMHAGRRRFLKMASLSFVLAGGGLCGYAALIAPERLRVRRYRLPVKDLPHELVGLTIVHVSDTHYGPYNAMSYLQRAVKLANSLMPDIIVLTGDYVHRTPRSIKPGIELLGALEARLGRVAVLGNHDHWEGAAACRAVFKRINIPLIDNNRLFLTQHGLQAECAQGHALCIAGVGDLLEDEILPKQALGGVPADVPRILLSHNPDVAEEMASPLRVDAILSGHTHGGQVNLPGIGTSRVASRYGNKYIAGLCAGPACPVIVSCGVGISVLPLRFGVRPDIGCITLVAKR